MAETIVCDMCPAGMRNDTPCFLCGGTGLLRKVVIKTSQNPEWEVWVPSNLTQEEAQVKYDKSVGTLMNYFDLTD